MSFDFPLLKKTLIQQNQNVFGEYRMTSVYGIPWFLGARLFIPIYEISVLFPKAIESRFKTIRSLQQSSDEVLFKVQSKVDPSLEAIFKVSKGFIDRLSDPLMEIYFGRVQPPDSGDPSFPNYSVQEEKYGKYFAMENFLMATFIELIQKLSKPAKLNFSLFKNTYILDNQVVFVESPFEDPIRGGQNKCRSRLKPNA